MSNYSENQYDRSDENTPWYKIFSQVPEGSRVLDIGCSSGNLGATLKKEKQCEVIGLDLNPEDVKKATKRLDAAYVRNAEHDDISDLGTFDCIIFADVIEHLQDPVSTLQKIKPSLNKTGAVIFSIPNMAHMSTRLMLMEGRFAYGETGLLDKTHLHYYDKQEVERVFKEAGYHLDEFDWVDRYLPENIVSNQLKNMGLIPTEVFLQKNREVESTAYEFIGRAKPVTGKLPQPASLPFASPYVRTIEDQVKNAVEIKEVDFLQEKAQLEAEIDDLKHQVARLIGSISWRTTLPLRLANGYVWHAKQRARILAQTAKTTPKYNVHKLAGMRSADEMYKANDKILSNIKDNTKASTAVVVHLYYSESWPAIRDRLKFIESKMPFGLFVTLPESNKHMTDDIHKDYPSACILEVPNRGRDVLPFLEVAKHLEALGYKYLLKLHSKKSPHRDDGKEWFGELIGSLLPDSPLTINALQKALDTKDTGIIGPHGQYVSLRVNYDGNSFFLFRILKRMYSNQVAKKIADNKADYGFFAGTMFWARLDALHDIFEAHFAATDFMHEGRHIDGTLAHGLERVFCITQAINGRQLYDIGPEGLHKIEYKTDNIPEWSDIHVVAKKTLS